MRGICSDELGNGLQIVNGLGSPPYSSHFAIFSLT
jgi:hypothetical protein